QRHQPRGHAGGVHFGEDRDKARRRQRPLREDIEIGTVSDGLRRDLPQRIERNRSAVEEQGSVGGGEQQWTRQPLQRHILAEGYVGRQFVLLDEASGRQIEEQQQEDDVD